MKYSLFLLALLAVALVGCDNSTAAPSGKDSMNDIVGEAPPPDKVNDGTKDGKPHEGEPQGVPRGGP